MPVVGLRQLSRETREVIDQLEQDGEPVVLTRHGKPVAALVTVPEDRAAAFALASLPEQVAHRDKAAKEIAAGEGRPAGELLAELEAGSDEDPDGLRAEIEQDEVEIPTPLVEAVGRAAAQSTPASRELISTGQLPAPYLEYVRAVLRASVHSGFERVRVVNENIIENSVERGGFSVESYADELESAAAVEILALRRSVAKQR